jgi:hypothetical protein
MATTPEQQPSTQSDGSQDKASAKKRDSIPQIIIDSINLTVTVGGLLTVFIAIFTWTVLGTSALIKALVTLGVIAIATTLTCVYRLKKAKQLSPVVAITAVSIGIICICATTTAFLHFRKAQSQPLTRATLSESAVVRRSTTIEFDQRGTAANPITVTCQYTVPVSGRLPKGYDFAIGNIVENNPGNAAPVFVPDTAVSPQDNTWRVPVTFGTSSNAGQKFEVYLVVMPTPELKYLVTEGQQTRKIDAQELLTGDTQKNATQNAINQSWWIAPGLPPSPAFTKDMQIYQRSPITSGCPKE